MENGGFWEAKMQEEEKKRDAYRKLIDYGQEQENADRKSVV